MRCAGARACIVGAPGGLKMSARNVFKLHLALSDFEAAGIGNVAVATILANCVKTSRWGRSSRDGQRLKFATCLPSSALGCRIGWHPGCLRLAVSAKCASLSVVILADWHRAPTYRCPATARGPTPLEVAVSFGRPTTDATRHAMNPDGRFGIEGEPQTLGHCVADRGATRSGVDYELEGAVTVNLDGRQDPTVGISARGD
jgi:hypothetical protein